MLTPEAQARSTPEHLATAIDVLWPNDPEQNILLIEATKKTEPSIPKINLCHLTNCTSCQTERSHPSLFVLLVYFLFL